MAGLRRYLTVGLANLTVKMDCSHYELTREVERSVQGRAKPMLDNTGGVAGGGGVIMPVV